MKQYPIKNYSKETNDKMLIGYDSQISNPQSTKCQTETIKGAFRSLLWVNTL